MAFAKFPVLRAARRAASSARASDRFEGPSARGSDAGVIQVLSQASGARHEAHILGTDASIHRLRTSRDASRAGSPSGTTSDAHSLFFQLGTGVTAPARGTKAEGSTIASLWM